MFRILGGCATLIFLIVALAILVALGALIVSRGGADLATSGATLSSSGQILSPAPLNSVFQKRALFSTIPLPQEVNRELGPILVNLLIASGIVIALGLIGAIYESISIESAGRVDSLLRAVGLRGVTDLLGTVGGWVVRRGLLGMPILVLLFVLMGGIFALNERQTGTPDLINTNRVQLAFALGAAVAVISLGVDLTTRLVSRLGRAKGRYGARPSTLLIAGAAMIFSRALGLQPGILFGLSGDVTLRVEGTPRRGLALALLTPITLLLIAGAGWLGVGVLAEVGRQVMPVETLVFFAPIAALGQTFGLAVFVIGIQTAFYALIPLGGAAGMRLFGWRKPVWALMTLPPTFIFTHILLNPSGDVMGALASPGVLLLLAVLIVIGGGGFAIWLYVRLIAPKPITQIGWYSPTATEPPPPAPRPPAKPLPQGGQDMPTPRTMPTAPPAPVANYTPPPSPPAVTMDENTQQNQALSSQNLASPLLLHKYLHMFPKPTPDEEAEIAADAEFMKRNTPRPPASPTGPKNASIEDDHQPTQPMQ
ncbi:MAG: hypothetical protein IT322_13580 [Anaerolineae bacterium]|nr:hypothetical protein [Anaerolineae bacterium]